jgi:hypothetical protein
MQERLVASSNVMLFGRVVQDLQVVGAAPVGLGDNRLLERQLDPGENPVLARIYGFSYEGRYYDLPKPTIFLVHGQGTPVPQPPPQNLTDTGEAAREWEFSDGMVYWEYDKGDLSIRFDVETGSLEQILLEATLAADPFGSYAGASARLSGASARVTGASARISGASARISGASARLRRGDWE